MIRLFCTFAIVLVSNADYWSEREKFIQSERSQESGAAIKLSEKEQIANEILMHYKLKEYDAGFEDPSKFPPALHFFESKPLIEQSRVFEIIRKLPKGGSLHSHSTSCGSFELLYNLTYHENLYAGCIGDSRLKFRFFSEKGVKNQTDCQWELVSKLRAQNSAFDYFLKTQLSILVNDPEEAYPTINDVWKRFSDTYKSVRHIILYKPVFEEYFYKVLQELAEDNLMYLELRSTLSHLYDLDNNHYPLEVSIQLLLKVLERFKRDYPNFIGAKLIYSPVRTADNKTADGYVKQALELKQKYPDFIAGFDLVGQEDLGKPLEDFLGQLQELAKNGMKFFFHAGETNWYGVPSDLNLVDAVLLNSTRIGHGFAVTKHPKILQQVKAKDIAIELNPISNQVLRLVDDLRNHAGVSLVADGYPVVIASDDPGFWGVKALSYDWYMAFMVFGSRESDLRLLKQFALNSINYSAMNDQEKSDALAKWTLSWDKFIEELPSQIPLLSTT